MQPEEMKQRAILPPNLPFFASALHFPRDHHSALSLVCECDLFLKDQIKMREEMRQKLRISKLQIRGRYLGKISHHCKSIK